MAGIRTGAVRFQYCAEASVRASVTVTCDRSATVDGTDELAFLGVTLAVEAAPANQNQFLKGANNGAMATNLAACINAHTTLTKFVHASASSADVVITFRIPGEPMNFIPITEVGNGMSLSSALFAGGVGMDSSAVNAFTY